MTHAAVAPEYRVSARHSPDDVNAPRCEAMMLGGRCRSQGAGEWTLGQTERRVVLCDDHRLSFEEQMRRPLDWHPFIPDDVRERIADRVRRMAARYFG